MRGRSFFCVFLLLIVPATGMAFRAVLVEFQRVGGFMGVREQLVVFEDGSVRLDRWSGRGGHDSFCAHLERKRLEDLRGTLDLAGFPHLGPEYLLNHPVNDGYMYAITYRGYTVRTQDPIEDAAPVSLRLAIRLLQEILQDVLEQEQACSPYARQGV